MGVATDAAEAEGARFDVAPLVSRAKEVLAQPVWDDANATSVFAKLKQAEELGELGFAGPNGIKALREAVNADIAATLRSSSPNSRQQLRNLEILKRDIDGVIENSPFDATKKAYGEFVDYYKREFAPRFLRGVNLMAEKRTSLGEPRLPPEKVFTNYFKPNGATEMARYLKLYGDNTEAMSAMRDAITDRYAREVLKDGVIDQAAHGRFMEKYRVPLGTLDKAGFKFGGDLQDTSQAFGAVNDRLSALQDAASRADKDLVRGIISDQYGARLPEQVIGEVMSDPRKANLLLSRMDKAQAKGLVEYMKDDLVRQFSKDGTITPDAIEAFLGDRMRAMSYRSALAKVYSPEAADAHMATLGRISEAAKRLDSTPVPRTAVVQGKPSLFNDELKRSTGLSVAVIGNMARAVITGRVSPHWAVMALGSQAGATAMMNMKNELYEQILKDPKSAQLLLQMMKSPPETASGLAAATRFIKQTPSFVSHLTGLNKYPGFAKFAALNFGREQSEPENE
jgi:hypothetical protein